MEKPHNDILAYAVWHSVVTSKKLPKNVYRYNAEKLVQGIYKGYKKNLITVEFNSPDYKMLHHLRTNVYMFSAAKTFQQVREMEKAREELSLKLVKGENVTPLGEFKKEVAKIDENYNTKWLETEYKTAISGGRNASMWERLQKDKATFPNMTYHTDHQDTVCDICEPLDGITLPIDDSFWDEFMPDNHFNCNCYVTQEDEDANLSDDSEVEDAEKAGDNMDAMWKRNVGKSGEVFNKEHPYFSISKEDREFAKSNFGLPIPKHDFE